MKKRLFLFLTLLVALLCFGCARTSERDVFRFEAHQLDMKLGEEVELKLIMGSVSEKEEIIYFTSEEGIVELNGNVAKAVSEGVVKVTAQVVSTPTTKATVEITVSGDRLSGLQIFGKDQMNINETINLAVETNPDYIPSDVIWTSSDENIATVTDSGKVTALRPGNVVISATSVYDKTMVAKKAIEVLYQATTGIELNFINGDSNVIMGTTSTLEAKVLPEGFANPNVTWTTSDAKYATVKNGVITPIKVTEGESTITITAKSVDGKEAKVEIKVVYAQAEAVTITASENEVFEEKTLALKAAVTPANANQAVTWESSDESIATVNEKGVVTAVKKGTVTITAKDSTGLVKGEVEITVTGRPDPEKIIAKFNNKEISEITIEIECDETIAITIDPSDAKQDYEFAISKEGIAEVDKVARGIRVTGVGLGDVTITITSTIDPTVTKQIVVHIIPLEE